jgi:hypothetical protein
MQGAVNPTPCHQALAALNGISTRSQESLEDLFQRLDDPGGQLQTDGNIDWHSLQDCLE